MAGRPFCASQARDRDRQTEQHRKAQQQHEERLEAGQVARDQRAETANIQVEQSRDEETAGESARGEGKAQSFHDSPTAVRA
jgi:hypothetical protein